jgi:hypothetical protein
MGGKAYYEELGRRGAVERALREGRPLGRRAGPAYVCNALLVAVCVRHGVFVGWRWDDVAFIVLAVASVFVLEASYRKARAEWEELQSLVRRLGDDGLSSKAEAYELGRADERRVKP